MNSLKKYLLATIMTMLFLAMPIASHAATGDVAEVEPNDNFSQAITIDRNLQTAAQLAASDLSGRHGTTGSLSSADDVDCFKVLLYSNQDNFWDFSMTNNSTGSIALQVCDENGNIVNANNFVYTKNLTDRTFRVIVPTTGIYYLKVSSISGVDEKTYGFTIGNPLYVMTSYSAPISSITIGPSNPTFTKSLDLSTISTLPNGSMVYEVILGGGTTTSTSSRKVCNASNSTWITAIQSIWSCKVPVNESYKLKQTWQVQYNGGSSNKTFTPDVYFKYVYPRLPQSEQY